MFLYSPLSEILLPQTSHAPSTRTPAGRTTNSATADSRSLGAGEAALVGSGNGGSHGSEYRSARPTTNGRPAPRDPVLWAAYTRGWGDSGSTVQNQTPPRGRGNGRRHPTAPRPSTASTGSRRGITGSVHRLPAPPPPPSTFASRNRSPARPASKKQKATPQATAPNPRRAVSPHPATTEWTGMPQPAGWWERDYPTTGLGPLDRLPPRTTTPQTVEPVLQPPPAPPAQPTPTTQLPPLPAKLNHRQRRNRERLEKFLAAKGKRTYQQHRLVGKIAPPPAPPSATRQVPPPAPEPMDTGDPAPEDGNTSGHAAPPGNPDHR